MDPLACVDSATLRAGNLTGVRRKTQAPNLHWVYQYQAVPDDAPPESFVLRNEMTQATLFAGTVINRQSTYGRSGQSRHPTKWPSQSPSLPSRSTTRAGFRPRC